MRGGGVRHSERLRRQRSAALETRSSVVSQIWPPMVDPQTLTQQVYDETSATSIPAVGKALHMLQLIATMSLSVYRGDKPVSRQPAVLTWLTRTHPGLTWFVQQHVRDYWVAGNACHLVTARGADNQPAAVEWRPASQWSVLVGPDGNLTEYRLQGRKVPTEDVVHVQRGHRPGQQGVGIGIVDEYLATLDRAKLEEESERQNLKNGAVPSAVIITPQKTLTQPEADRAADSWMTKMSGPGRRPVILPNDTQVIPLGWSATDQQMIEARQMSLTDVANLTGMDPYWLGAPSSSHTYRSPGPLWLMLLRMSLEPTAQVFEDVWSQAWLPWGQRIRFDRNDLTRDDLGSEITSMATALDKRLFTWEEARTRLGMDPTIPRPKADTPPALAAGQQQQDGQQGSGQQPAAGQQDGQQADTQAAGNGQTGGN